jgi:hypothetical protein
MCDCGTKKTVGGDDLKSGKVVSCKCYNREISTTHKMSKTKFYGVWSNMKERCSNPKHPGYKDYGSRGITVCERWLDFNNFYQDMHETYKEGLTIERRDVNSGYEPSNCKWADSIEQQNNRRISKRYRIDGELMTPTQIARKYNLSIDMVRGRLDKGLTVKQAITEPNRRYPDKEKIKELYKTAKSIREVSLKTGYTWSYVKKVINE